MKNIKLYLIASLIITFMLSAQAEAKWWIFGQSNEEVSINYLYINKVSFEEGGPKLVIYRETLPEGTITINGKASVKKGKIGSVRVSINDREKWEDAKFSDNGAFEYMFKPEPGRAYIIYVEIMDTAGKTNDIEATRKEVSISDESIQDAVRHALDAMIEAYRNENAGLFMSYVSEEFAGDAVNLDRAVRKDFSAFDNIDIRYTINNISSNDKGIFVSLNYNRTVISSRSGQTLTDKGMTEFVFRNGEEGPKAYSMKNPLIFGLSDAAEVATGTVMNATNESILVVDENGNAETMPFNDAIAFINGEEAGESSTVESGTFTLMTTCVGFLCTYEGFVFADADVTDDGSGDINIEINIIFPAPGVMVVDLGVIDIDSVTEAPDAGYADAPFFGEGHCFAIKLADGKYAIVEILDWTEISPDPTLTTRTRFKYKYQTDGSRNF